MKILLFMLALLSQAFAIIITPSNMTLSFPIDSVDGVGCVAVPAEFKTEFKANAQNQFIHLGTDIKQCFCEYITNDLQLNNTEEGILCDLLNKEISDPLMLIPFDSVLSMLRAQ